MTKKIKKAKDVFSVKDFKMWLQGLREFQEPGWTPNAKQWNTILDKVEQLEDGVQYVTVQETETPLPRQATYTSHTGGQGPQPPAPRFLNEQPTERNGSGVRPAPAYGSVGNMATTDSGILDIPIHPNGGSSFV